MSYNLENRNNSEIKKTQEVKVDSEKLSETEETAEKFDDCYKKEIKDSNGNEVNAETLKEAEENYDECETKLEEMKENNSELEEDDDDFSDCDKEMQGHYVAEVTYTIDDEISRDAACVEMQEAYNECNDPEDMQQLKENINENEHIHVEKAEVVERPELVETSTEYSGDEFEENQAELKEAQEELEEAQEELEVQQEAAQEYQEELESQINEQEREIQEETEDISREALEETISETSESTEETEETTSETAESTEETEETTSETAESTKEAEATTLETVESTEKVAFEMSESAEEVEKTEEIVSETAENPEEVGEAEKRVPKIENLQKRIDEVLKREEISTKEITVLKEENVTAMEEIKNEKSTTDADATKKFEEVLSKARGSEEYNQALQEFNVLQKKKEDLNKQLSTLEQQQRLLGDKSLELQEAENQKVAETTAVATVTLATVDMLQERYDRTCYNEKPDKKELSNIREESFKTISELGQEKEVIKRAMETKEQEICTYVSSNNLTSSSAAQDWQYQKLNKEYLELKRNYDRLSYSAIKLDENNKYITELLGDDYVSMIQLTPSFDIAKINNDIKNSSGQGVSEKDVNIYIETMSMMNEADRYPVMDSIDKNKLDSDEDKLKVLKMDELELLKAGDRAIRKRLEVKADDYRDKGYSEEEIDKNLVVDEWNYRQEFLKDAFPEQDVSPFVFRRINEEETKEFRENDKILETVEFRAIVNGLENKNVEYRQIELSEVNRTTEEIIERLSGGDKTDGSCSSLALAYAGNRAGFDVLDFRGGESCTYFSTRTSIQKIAELPEVESKILSGTDDIECANQLIDEMKPGKEYYLATGQHAAIVRRNGDKIEYLELQHPTNRNGWHKLNNFILSSRFGCSRIHFQPYTNYLMDVDSLANSREFLCILGYINTADTEQRKGASGNVR